MHYQQGEGAGYDGTDHFLHFSIETQSFRNGARARDVILHELHHAFTDSIYDDAYYPTSDYDYSLDISGFKERVPCATLY